MRTVLRKVWHILGLVFPASYYFGVVSKKWALVAAGVFFVGAVALEVCRLCHPPTAGFFNRLFGPIMRDAERRGLNATPPYVLGVFLVMLIFPKGVAFAATACLAFGDVAAELVGRFVGRVALVPGKTLEGAAACFGVCFLATLLFFPWPVALAAAAAATLAELFSRGWTDNLVMPLAAAAAMWLAGHFAHIPLS